MVPIDVDRVGAVSVVADPSGWISTEDMIEVDRVMIEDLHIELIQMMENAGRLLARVVRSLVEPTTATVLVGSGGNGGGGLVAARHLANAGVDVAVVTTRAVGELTGVPAHQADILDRLGVPLLVGAGPGGLGGLGALGGVGALGDLGDPGDVDVVVDAVIGYSLRGAPRGVSAELVELANRSSAPVVSLDVPSGLDATTGATPGAVVDADVTVTLAAPKAGLAASRHVGELFVADISVPPAVVAGVGGVPIPFGPDGLVHVDTSSLQTAS